MKKKKFNLKKYAGMGEEVTITGEDGTEVIVRKHIPYADKVAMATEMAETSIMVHDDSCNYTSHLETAIEMLYTAKYYTNINTDGAEMTEIADFFINNGIMKALEEVIEDDIGYVMDLYYTIKQSTMTVFDDDRSLRKAVRTSFPFLFNGEDVTQSLANAETVSGTLFDALAALRKEKKQDENKMEDGVLNVNGNILNFAKRE